jgi:hypothetical protein
VSYHVKWYQIPSYHVISCHIMSYHVISCHVMSYHVISCHIMSYNVISCHVMSYNIMSYQVKSYHLLLKFSDHHSIKLVRQAKGRGRVKYVFLGLRRLLRCQAKGKIWVKSPHNFFVRKTVSKNEWLFRLSFVPSQVPIYTFCPSWPFFPLLTQLISFCFRQYGHKLN